MNRSEYRKSRKAESAKIEPDLKAEDEQADTFLDDLKDVLKNKGVITLLTLAGIIVVAIGVLLSTKINQQPTVREVDFTKLFPDIEYSVDVDVREDEVIGWVVSKELEPVDAVSLTSAIRKEKGLEVKLLVFETDFDSKVKPDFHAEGLRYDIQSFSDNNYESRVFVTLPSIDANVERVREWTIKTEDSYVDSTNTLHIKGSVPTLASTEETIAFLKGLNTVVSDINEHDYTNTIYTVESGLNTFVFSENHPSVIANVELYQMQNVTKGK